MREQFIAQVLPHLPVAFPLKVDEDAFTDLRTELLFVGHISFAVDLVEKLLVQIRQFDP